MEKHEIKSTKLDQGEAILHCKDHLVSEEEFEILDLGNGILQTNPFPEDLDRYYQSEDYISHTDSSRNFQDKIYQFVKSRMLSKKAKWISRHKKEGRILDYGAGTGDFLNDMKTRNWEVVGVEPNPGARDLGLEKGLDVYGNLSEINSGEFDVITLWHVLEHVPDFENILRQLRSKLKKDGILVIAVPNYRSYDSYYYNNIWAAWDVPRHLWHFSRDGLKRSLEDLKFTFREEKPLVFDPFYVSMLSEKNKETKGSMLNAFFRGLLSNLSARSTGEYSSLAYFFSKD